MVHAVLASVDGEQNFGWHCRRAAGRHRRLSTVALDRCFAAVAALQERTLQKQCVKKTMHGRFDGGDRLDGMGFLYDYEESCVSP